jgi:hypothetical protein
MHDDCCITVLQIEVPGLKLALVSSQSSALLTYPEVPAQTWADAAGLPKPSRSASRYIVVGPVYPLQEPQTVVDLSELIEQAWLPDVHAPAGLHDWLVPAGHWQ